jgi:TRAP-type C4-dicarboxylate transport system permease large subunit
VLWRLLLFQAGRCVSDPAVLHMLRSCYARAFYISQFDVPQILAASIRNFMSDDRAAVALLLLLLLLLCCCLLLRRLAGGVLILQCCARCAAVSCWSASPMGS